MKSNLNRNVKLPAKLNDHPSQLERITDGVVQLELHHYSTSGTITHWQDPTLTQVPAGGRQAELTPPSPPLAGPGRAESAGLIDSESDSESDSEPLAVAVVVLVVFFIILAEPRSHSGPRHWHARADSESVFNLNLNLKKARALPVGIKSANCFYVDTASTTVTTHRDWQTACATVTGQW